VANRETEGTSRAKKDETMKKNLVKRTAKAVSKKQKSRALEVPSEEEIRDLESLEIPEKVKREVCHEVAEQMGISVEEVRELMKKLESNIPSI